MIRTSISWFALTLIVACTPFPNGDNRGYTAPRVTAESLSTSGCAQVSAQDRGEYAAWGKRQGYLKLIHTCAGTPVNTAWFLLKDNPRIVVVAVCDGESGERRCLYNKMIRD